MSGHPVSANLEPAHGKSGLHRRALLSGFATLPMLSSLLAVKNATAQQANSGFSFAVCGDSRPMMYQSRNAVPTSSSYSLKYSA